MQNLLILYNPYYNKEMIEDHIRILNKANKPTEARVAFGKVRSKMRDYEHSKEDRIVEICKAVSPDNPMQLFLTDFSSVYVCYVEKVAIDRNGISAPNYYDKLDVEGWFILRDIREVVRNDFVQVREQVLVNFTTPNYGNYTFALYGNRYDYPLEVNQKKQINYFEDFSLGVRHFTNVFKSNKYAQIQLILEQYIFGKELMYDMHPDTIESLVGAEVQYDTNKDNAIYDFAPVVIQFSKAFENESYYFLRKVFRDLMVFDCDIEDIEYSVQGKKYTLYDYLNNKPNLGTNKFLLGNRKIYSTYKDCYSDYTKYKELLMLLSYKIKKAITIIQDIRNEAAHGGVISKKDCDIIRNIIFGIGEESIMVDILKQKRDNFSF